MFCPDFLYNRDPESHKGRYGHALLIAGSYGKMGAAVLAARACLRAGVGLLTVHVPRSGVAIMQTAVPEAMLSIDIDEYLFTSLPAHLERYDAVAAGPGIGTGECTQKALIELLETMAGEERKGQRVVVLDADALNILAKHPESMHLAAGAVITPHDREYGHLFGDADTQAMADLHNLVIVRKAHRTKIFAPHSEPLVNDSGNPGMATAGSGDVLTGVALALFAQHRAYQAGAENVILSERQQLAALAVSLHGTAGDAAADGRHQYSVIASDIIEAL